MPAIRRITDHGRKGAMAYYISGILPQTMLFFAGIHPSSQLSLRYDFNLAQPELPSPLIPQKLCLSRNYVSRRDIG